MKKSKTKLEIGVAAHEAVMAELNRTPSKTPARIVALTGREVDIINRSLSAEWAVLQSRIVEFAAGDNGASARLARRQVEELDILTAKIRGERP